MGQLQNNNDEIYSVLYVDFDNMYARLHEQDPALARIFATAPHRWMRWIDGHAIRMMYGDGVRRRILKKICYMNPIRYAEFKPHFSRAAFIVTDCIPSINQVKTNVDILLTMQCLDDLRHATHFDEFILFSADSDFTPLIYRINEHARRSIVLSVGYISPAYAAACSWRIREDWFITQALEEGRDEAEDGGERFEGVAQGKSVDAKPEYKRQHNSNKEATPSQSKNTATNLPVYQRMKLVEAIKQLSDESAAPVQLPSIAQVLQAEFDGAQDWFGAGTLRELIESLDIRPLKFSAVGQGCIYDPERHRKPDAHDPRGDFRESNPELFNFAYAVHGLAAVPLLKPEHYKSLLTIIVSELQTDGYAENTINNISEVCIEENLPVSQQHIGFILEAVREGGVDFGKDMQEIASTHLHTALLNRISGICKGSGMKFGATEHKWLTSWLGEQ